ncbi:hypothetical protein N7532_004357 [Penicillium argentinense]|uniref:Uncharacterized protein n=1 Tax=Penicillium argentinense TaxID=1131581 RepID=A0A9W9KFK0_9EURO|nr:uncharacterized protein N7532_004357 [Penicillium argentinense]KAJ5103828.1 hypothetical protein N7532_004357 [Penicillium argentinense]
MAPIRRYLRISKYSVLECRIYTEKPSDARWLLNAQDPVLPRVFKAIRPLVLPRLREENERLWLRKKAKPVKDVITEDDFEVGIFLRESRTRHSLLTRHKNFEQPEKQEDTEAPSVPGNTLADAEVIEDSEDEPVIDLQGIPQAADDDIAPADNRSSRRRRRRVSAKVEESEDMDQDSGDDKKMGFSTHYESFNICGWVLCLLISRKSDKAVSRPRADPSAPKQPLMEEWISTQAQPTLDED